MEEISPWIVAAILVTTVFSVINFGSSALTFIEKVKETKRPHDEHVAMVKEHDQKLLNDYHTIRDMQTELRLLLSSQLQVLDHIISGNHIDKLKESRDFIERYLIDK